MYAFSNENALVWTGPKKKDTDTWPILDRYFTDSQSLHVGRYVDRYVGRQLTDISANCRPTIGRLSADSRPIYRSTSDRYIGRHIDRDHL